LGIVLVNLNIGRYEIIPDIIGLVLLFFCSVLFTDRAGRFARTAVVAVVMAFLEVVRLFSLVEADIIITALSMMYAFLQVILVITVADGIAQFSQLQGNDRVPRLCDFTGHLYALTFVCTILGGWLYDLRMVFSLIYYLITVYAVIMFFYFYCAVHTPLAEHELPFFEYRGPDIEEGMEGAEGLEMVGDLEGTDSAEGAEGLELTLEIDPLEPS
jgi:hypothetical protein